MNRLEQMKRQLAEGHGVDFYDAELSKVIDALEQALLVANGHYAFVDNGRIAVTARDLHELELRLRPFERQV